MANVKISELAELTTPAADDKMVIVDASEALDADKTKYITVSNLRAGATFLTTPLTSTAWDGDARSTTAKTKIDLSAVFGAPAGVKAILARISARDSASAGTQSLYFALSPNDAALSHAMAVKPSGLTNDYVADAVGIVPCDANGDVYYQIKASGTNTMDCWFQIWGYWL